MYLYRALRPEEIQQNYILLPKSQKPFRANPIIRAGTYFPFYPTATPRNAVRYHQWEQNGIRTSGISTTPHLDRAVSYAQHNKVIVKIDRTLLFQFGIMEYIVKDYVIPKEIACPEDDEVILVKLDGGNFPKNIITEIIKIISWSKSNILYNIL